MHFHLLTLFPDMFPGPLGVSLAGRARDHNIWDYTAIDIRDAATDKHQTVDDTPYGGGAGMVMRCDIIDRAIQQAKPLGRKIYLSPRGALLTQSRAAALAREENITLLCGRYEGVDQRVLDAHDFEEISVGDYVLSGGEMAALVLMDAIIRLLPGVMGNQQTVDEESFANGLLEYPHYTRPPEWLDNAGNARNVPEILTSGHHGHIKDWRFQQSCAITQQRRPDLWQRYQSTNGEAG